MERCIIYVSLWGFPTFPGLCASGGSEQVGSFPLFPLLGTLIPTAFVGLSVFLLFADGL